MSYSTIKACIKGAGRYLSIDAKGMSAYAQAGAGAVSSTTTLGPLSTLWIECYSNGTCSIRAPNAPGVYLRLDNPNNAVFNGGGVGVANCQYWKEGTPGNSREVFALRTQTDGSCAIESVSQPGNFLRMHEGGVVNLQFWAKGTNVGNCEILQVWLLN